MLKSLPKENRVKTIVPFTLYPYSNDLLEIVLRKCSNSLECLQLTSNLKFTSLNNLFFLT